MDTCVNYQRLEKNVSDMILEGFLKIGYQAGQPVRIYYDENLLRHLLAIDTAVSLEAALKGFGKYVKDRLDAVITPVNGRYECFVSAKGGEFIYQNNNRRSFLKELLETLQRPGCQMTDILPVFKKEAADIQVEETTGEFQYVVSFCDKEVDEFKYCFTFDEMGCYYHRLLEYDFARL